MLRAAPAGDGTTELHWAAHDEDLDRVKALLKSGADPRARNDYGSSPLSEAAVTGNVAVLKALLDAGADVESANDDGQTALMIVARGGRWTPPSCCSSTAPRWMPARSGASRRR